MSSPLPTAPKHDVPQPPIQTPPGAGGASGRRRPSWVTPVVVAGSLAVGLAIGAAGGGSGDPTTTDQYRALEAQLATARTDADTAGQQAASAQDAAEAGTKAKADADAREKKLDTREAALDKREKSLDTREDAVEGKEKKAKASEIEDGTWTVGTDIAPGTYKVKDKITSMCYWAILRTGSNGEDIITNDLPTGGYPSVTLKKGQDFDNQCGTWQKVG